MSNAGTCCLPAPQPQQRLNFGPISLCMSLQNILGRRNLGCTKYCCSPIPPYNSKSYFPKRKFKSQSLLKTQKMGSSHVPLVMEKGPPINFKNSEEKVTARICFQTFFFKKNFFYLFLNLAIKRIFLQS